MSESRFADEGTLAYIAQLLAHIAQLEAKCAKAPEGWALVQEEAIEHINQWAKAYPLDMFPEPDFEKAREALATVGIALDSVSASNMRHVITKVRDLLAAAPQPASKATPLDLMECLTDRPIEPSGAVKDKCVAAPKAEQQEPFAWYDPRDGIFTTFKDTAEHWQQKYGLELAPLYLAPPDIVAEHDPQLLTIAYMSGAADAKRRIAELEAEKQEPVLSQYQGSDGNWYPFDSELHKEETLLPGSGIPSLPAHTS